MEAPSLVLCHPGTPELHGDGAVRGREEGAQHLAGCWRGRSQHWPRGVLGSWGFSGCAVQTLGRRQRLTRVQGGGSRAVLPSGLQVLLSLLRTRGPLAEEARGGGESLQC